ncbi:MFS general substrate transporter [Trichoderma citrinoviride]|uniref:MFS general substrate transporter n=1 Tax=Trichoderma citrinoviride TaxID=58853 RepID=A0A2T4B1U5_9HYPO|nr:MFS general substrate transporter [Trichoderma citrinoviride]PTB63296.1 MFS general substrate transporter [Trichoderma citrinoviride]
MEEATRDRTLQDIENELDITIYPGTEVMVDVGSHHFIKSGSGNGDARVLVPQPSDDPLDPLNWTFLWKLTTIICASFVSISQNLGPLANAPLFGLYMEEWNVSLADAVQTTAVTILILGFSNLVWIPISTCFGRRPALIFSTLVCTVSSIWRVRATSYKSFLGASALNGFGAGPCESLMPQIIADIIFLHDRGKYQTLYFAIYFGSLSIGPIIAGSMAERFGWRSFWWFNTGLLIFTLVLNITLLPETRFARKTHPNPTSESNPSVEEPEIKKSSVIDHSENGSSEQPQDPWLSRGHPSLKQFLPWGPYQGSILQELWLPWYLHAFPIVEFAAFIVSFSASGFLVANLTQQQFFAAPPYNFTTQEVGFTNFAIFAGSMIGLLTSGPLSDWVANYFTKRNRGIREPEMRLLTMLPYTLGMIIGLVVVGVGYSRFWSWKVIVIIGYTLLGMQVTSLPSIASTYAIDSYKPATGAIFIAITINKNLWGYGVGKFITPWTVEAGYLVPVMTLMALITFFCSFGILFWYCGKWFRGRSKNSFLHQLDS